ncbi:hypothetical protein PVA45_07170 (plasmid) [Entomospira entomophila]|uniref:Uncharacterized protein n=1 Tax=Entomospira entomophila TaxID=2719988 RepID=A0A968GB10_9SPIO|nr:hypothetical protein [Entomospira entomophilus]NIZ41361.1 hypothetical protein [Entomospira entomophilus]WDI36228.1 hypothetical protein PVA45_07170 [Entomospira entomophilus]
MFLTAPSTHLQDPLSMAVSYYQQAFTQPYPRYAMKVADQWRFIDNKLGWHQTRDHITHKHIIGTLGRWYPHYGILDFDNVSLQYVKQTQRQLGLNTRNSQIFTSESKNSYHLYFKPRKKGDCVTLRYYQKAMNLATNYCEVYPQANRVIRLPFGRHQYYVDGQSIKSINYIEGMQLLDQLEDFELSHIAYSPDYDDASLLSSNAPLQGMMSGWKQEGFEYLQTGLTAFGSRLEATKRVIYFYWTQNLTPEICKQETKHWIKEKNNGLSKDWNHHPLKVYQQIDQLTEWLYSSFIRHQIMPDLPNLMSMGFLTKKTVLQVLQASRGQLPKMKFIAKILSYLQASGGNLPRSIHRDKLVSWSSERTYLRHLEDLDQEGIIKRSHSYSTGNYAKRITLLQPKEDPTQMIAKTSDADRPADCLQEWIPAVISQKEYFHTQKHFGLLSRTIHQQIHTIWGDKIASTPHLQSRSPHATAVKHYRAKYPQASQKETAIALSISIATVKRYWRDFDQKYHPQKK